MRPERPPEGVPQRKSLGHESTFAPTADARFVEGKVRALAEEVADELQKEGLKAQTVTVKLKRANFEVVQRQLTLPSSTNGTNVLREAALQLLRKETPYGGAARVR